MAASSRISSPFSEWSTISEICPVIPGCGTISTMRSRKTTPASHDVRSTSAIFSTRSTVNSADVLGFTISSWSDIAIFRRSSVSRQAYSTCSARETTEESSRAGVVTRRNTSWNRRLIRGSQVLQAALVHSRSGSTTTFPTTDGRAWRSNVATAASVLPVYDSMTEPPMTYSTRSISSNGSSSGPSSVTWKKHSPIRSPSRGIVTSNLFSCVLD